MHLMTLWLVTTLLLLLITVDARDGVCDVENMSALLGTSKYLLYGLTADCQLFFAIDIPEGIDLGRHFGPGRMHEDEPPSVNESHWTQTYDCTNATLHPLRDVRGRLRLLLIFNISNSVYAAVHDFQTPPKGKWFVKSPGPVLECRNERQTCQTKGQFLKKVNYNNLHWLNVDKTRERAPAVFGFVDGQESIYYLIDPEDYISEDDAHYRFILRAFTLGSDGQLKFDVANSYKYVWKESTDRHIEFRRLVAADVYANYMYFESSGSQRDIQRYRLSDVLQETFTFDWLVKPVDFHKAYDHGKFSIANNKVLGVQEGLQLNELQIYVETIHTGKAQIYGRFSGIALINRVCIGRLRRPAENDDFHIHYNRLDNFQIYALLDGHYEEVIKANTIATSSSTSTVSASTVSKNNKTTATTASTTVEAAASAGTEATSATNATATQVTSTSATIAKNETETTTSSSAPAVENENETTSGGSSVVVWAVHSLLPLVVVIVLA